MTTKSCEKENCENIAKFHCPTCEKLKLKNSYFCSQECFKSYWGVHKQKHKQNKETGADPFPYFQYTGTLRPEYPLSPKRNVPVHVEKPDYALTSIPKSEEAERYNSSIRVLTIEEQGKLRKVCKMERKALEVGAAMVKPGISTDEIDKAVHDCIINMNAYPSPLNYRGFPKSICTSVNEVICHGIPDMRLLRSGDIVNLDITVFYDGFHGDLNETYLVGDVDEAGKNLVNSSKECLEKAIAAVKPGVRYREIGDIIEKIAVRNGHSVVRTYCGHGIHRLFHCAPNIPHYSGNKAIGVMRPGHAFTIEPMISEGVWQDVHWPDGWTAVTRDGKRSAQFEHTLLVTEDGVEILTARDE
jgi:methionyl aminopeptidase